MVGVFQSLFYSLPGKSRNSGLFRLSVQCGQYDLTKVFPQEQYAVSLQAGQS